MPKIKPGRHFCIGFSEVTTHTLINRYAVKLSIFNVTEIPQMQIQMICKSGNPPQVSKALRFYYPPLPVRRQNTQKYDNPE